jgi:hypothetical protein
MTFSIVSNPGFASIAKTGQTAPEGVVATARLTLEPNADDAGTHTVTIAVRDGRGGADSADCTIEVTGAVTVTLVLPGAAESRPFGAFIDDDIDPDNGYVSAVMGLAGAGTELTYSLGAVPTGSYFAYAAVCVVSDCSAGPQDGDWFGLYGTPVSLDLSAGSGYVGDYVTAYLTESYNANVPLSGTASFEIILRDFVLAEEVALRVGDVSATEFIVSIDDSPYAVNLFMPNAGAAGSHQVVASFQGAIVTDPEPWTQLLASDPTEPDNDDLATAYPIGIPFDGVGSFLNGDDIDCYVFTLDAETTVEGLLNWNTEKDLDLFVVDEAAEFECAAASYDKPERAVCTLPAGVHYVLVSDYDAFTYNDFSLVSYRGTAGVSQGVQAAPVSRATIDPEKMALIQRLREDG